MGMHDCNSVVISSSNQPDMVVFHESNIFAGQINVRLPTVHWPLNPSDSARIRAIVTGQATLSSFYSDYVNLSSEKDKEIVSWKSYVVNLTTAAQQ